MQVPGSAHAFPDASAHLHRSCGHALDVPRADRGRTADGGGVTCGRYHHVRDSAVRCRLGTVDIRGMRAPLSVVRTYRDVVWDDKIAAWASAAAQASSTVLHAGE
jgi:hypothetical protein